ncbi:MAG: sulfotransferase [Pseudomonadota bacterium]
MAAPENRTEAYTRVSELEALLGELNGALAGANQSYLKGSSEHCSKVFLFGPLRCGSTLFMQWLGRTGLVAYPTNLLSRFYGAPLVGARIQQLLTEPRYNFRNEILDFNSEISFTSDNGKTLGALAPNEFWYFWRRFLPFDELDYLPGPELSHQANLSGLREELNALANIFEKPFAMKAMIMNQNIPELAAQFENALFIQIRRDPIFNIQSALEARKRQYGDIHTWYSFKIKEYPKLKQLDPLESVAGQIIAINKAIEEGMASLDDHKKLLVQYEEFCRNPEIVYNQIASALCDCSGSEQPSVDAYRGGEMFQDTNEWRLDDYSFEEAVSAYDRMKSYL